MALLGLGTGLAFHLDYHRLGLPTLLVGTFHAGEDLRLDRCDQHDRNSLCLYAVMLSAFVYDACACVSE